MLMYVGIGERGMVVLSCLDPLNPQWSISQLLNRLQNGEFDPFHERSIVGRSPQSKNIRQTI